ncbi:hypothetical protein ACQKOF_02770 [Lysinibacillus sp. NPDC093190]|uniref:hypothetical protein n=1 Tax=Lysinibacillus sp. NPDC093190 TaxID=3390575 RepID=UPI003D00AD2E
MNEYRLYPPFFKDELDSSFADAWERFCLKLIKIENNTEDIKKRKPPESGVDLFYQSKKIAYQCKSLEENSIYNITNSVKSLKSALQIKESLGWEKYVICANTELTGNQEATLKSLYANIEVKDKEYWIGLCKKYPYIVQENFKLLIDTPSNYICEKIKDSLVISENIKEILSESTNCISTWFYIHKRDNIFKIPITLNMKIGDLIDFLRSIIGLPQEPIIDTQAIKMSYGVSIFEPNQLSTIERKYYTLADKDKRLTDLNVKSTSVIEFYINYEIIGNKDIAFQFDSVNEKNIENWINKKEECLINEIETFQERGYI